jgi:type IV pilus assembly protein PilQ
MIPSMLLWTAVLATLTSVKGLGVMPVADRTEVVIEVDGAVSARDFMLDNPARLVVDITGARHQMTRDRFAAIDRGGVRALRISQFEAEVVRVVVDLTEAVAYRIEQENGQIRLSFPNRHGAFEPWHAGTPAVRSVAVEPLRAIPQPAYNAQQPPITVFFRETPILDVLATFAEFSGRSIVAGSQVSSERITADIRGQPWDVALEAMLQSHSLAAREMESGIIRVERMEEIRRREQSDELETRQFRIRYVAADSLASVVRGLIEAAASAAMLGDAQGGQGAQRQVRAHVAVNRANNALVVTAGRSILDRVAPRISELDVRTPQVTIAAKIIFIERTALEELGVTYDLKDSRGNQLNSLVSGRADLNGDGVAETVTDNVVLLSGNSVAALANATIRVTQPQLQVLTSLVLGRHTLVNFIEALQQMTLSDVQATPLIRTMDHREARIQVGEKTPIRVVDAGGFGGGVGGQGAPTAAVEIQETGIILRVTPHVTGSQILLELHAENSRVALAPADIGFTFSTQEAQTQVLVNDGETAVIGGLTVIEKNRVRTGIPILMDLPVIGALFRTSRDNESKRDLLIMVTPHIID